MGIVNRWMQGAVKHPGAETAAAKQAGQTVHQYAEAHKSAPGTAGKRARLALTFEKTAAKRGGHANRHKNLGKFLHPPKGK